MRNLVAEKRSKNRKLYATTVLTMTLLIYGIIVNTGITFYWTCLTSMVAIILVGFTLYFGKQAVTGGVLYFLCLVIMHSGQYFIIALNWSFSKALRNSVAIGKNIDYSSEAVVFTTVCCILVAIVICLLEKDEEEDLLPELKAKPEQVYLSNLGWIIVWGIVGLTVISDIVKIMNVSVVGYGEGFQQSNTILYFADLLFPLAIFLMVSTYKNNYRLIKWLFRFIILRSAVSMFLIGSRGKAVLNIIMCIFIILKLTDNKRLKQRVKKEFAVLCILGIILLPFTGLARTDEGLTFYDFIVGYNPITYSLTEFGGTIINVRLAIENQMPLGMDQYFSSYLSIIPLSGTMLPFLNSTYGNTYHMYLNKFCGGNRLGGSVIGEGAFWFGDSFGGYLYMIAIAVVVVLCLNAVSGAKKKNSIVINTTVSYLLYNVFLHIRGTAASLQSGIKLMIYFYILFTFFNKYLFIRGKNGYGDVQKNKIKRGGSFL